MVLFYLLPDSSPVKQVRLLEHKLEDLEETAENLRSEIKNSEGNTKALLRELSDIGTEIHPILDLIEKLEKRIR